MLYRIECINEMKIKKRLLDLIRKDCCEFSFSDFWWGSDGGGS